MVHDFRKTWGGTPDQFCHRRQPAHLVKQFKSSIDYARDDIQSLTDYVETM